MIEIEAEIKAWGNSAGVIIPNEIMKKENISKGDVIGLKINKKNILKEISGALKDMKPKTNKTTDRLLKEIDEGWSKYG